MKNKIILLLITILFIPLTVNALTYSNTYDGKINDIVAYDEGYIKVIDNKLYSYVNDELISTKQFTDINNVSLKKYNDNFILIGLKNNTLKSYIIDKNLKVLNTKDTSYIISNGSPKIYSYENKNYILFIEDEILTTNNVYIIDENLNIEEKKLSNVENIKDILSSDYYMITNSGNTQDGITENYESSTYINDNSIIVGYVENALNGKNAIIKVLDKNGYILWQDSNKDYIEYKDCIILENKIYILANNGAYTFLVEYDTNGKIISSKKISDSISYKFAKVVPNLYVLNELNQIVYKYEININIESSIYGTTTYTGESIPYNDITINPVANSGYIVKNIIVTDEQGNEIKVENNKFKMPSSSVNIKVEYEETIINPDTVDMIFVVMAVAAIALIIFTRTYKQYKWLKG